MDKIQKIYTRRILSYGVFRRKMKEVTLHILRKRSIQIHYWVLTTSGGTQNFSRQPLDDNEIHHWPLCLDKYWIEFLQNLLWHNSEHDGSDNREKELNTHQLESREGKREACGKPRRIPGGKATFSSKRNNLIYDHNLGNRWISVKLLSVCIIFKAYDRGD